MSPSQTEQKHFDELGKYFNDAEIVEIVATISLFGFLNRWNDSMATEIEELPETVAQATIGDSFGWKSGKHK